MAVVKPMNPKINFEGAWKEFRREYSHKYIHGMIGKDPKKDTHLISNLMDDLEQSYMQEAIHLKRRSNLEIIDYCIKKSVEAQMENIHLKKKLRETKESEKKLKKDKIYIHMEYIKIDDVGFVQEGDEIREKDCEYEIDKMMNNGEYRHYVNSMGKIIKFQGDKIRVVELRILSPKKPKETKYPYCTIMNTGEDMILEKKRKPKRKLFNIHLVTVTKDDLEFTFDWKVTGKKLDYLKTSYEEKRDISWHGLKMRIVELNIHYSDNIESRSKREF